MKNRTIKERALALTMALAFLTLTGCGTQSASQEPTPEQLYEEAYTQSVDVPISVEEQEVPLAAAPPVVASISMPQASGTAVQKNAKAVIDYSNVKDGYVMVKYTASTSKKLKARVTGPSKVNYDYDLKAGAFSTLPLSDGNGSYKVSILENVSGTSYASVVSASFTATLKDQFAPFLQPNQYVNFTQNSKVVSTAADIVKKAGANTPLKKVEAVYEYVVNNLTYDTNKAKTVQSGYLPVVDTVLAQKKGICFDYAAVMAAMLRSQGVPTKLVVGYSKDVYHAWINVYTPESGWVDAVIFFDGKSWKLMDPTFASSGKNNANIIEYIGNGANYSAKYCY